MNVPEIKRRVGEETITSDLTYDLRSGNPDFMDKLVALTFGNMAFDAILEGKTGLMSALVEGRYDLVPIPDVNLGSRKLDVAGTYNTERYRPIYGGQIKCTNCRSCSSPPTINGPYRYRYSRRAPATSANPQVLLLKNRTVTGR